MRGGRPSFVPGQVIVKFRDGSPVEVRQSRGRFKSASAAGVSAVLRQYGAESVEKLFPREKHKAANRLRITKSPTGETIKEHNLDQVYMVQMGSLRPDSTLQLVSALDSLPDVEYAEPNYIAYISSMPTEGAAADIPAVPTDAIAPAAAPGDGGDVICANPRQNPYYSQNQWGIDFEGLPELWQKPIINAKRPVIAIIDTGVDLDHPDLKPNLWTNSTEAEGEPDYDNDGNGFAGDVHGWDFINNSPNIRDYNSHGTHCAGIAAAADNEIGVVGANPKALIMPVTVMQSDGTGDYATIVKGINYAVANGATVLSMSFGGYTNSRVLREAMENAYHSAVLVAAAGNDRKPIYPQCGINSRQCFPAAYSFVLGVQALADGGSELADYSNFDCDGPNYSAVTTANDPEGFNYEVSAPGSHILSTVPGGNYRYLSGTSMAAPLVAGAVSALQMVKEYNSQEILWADITHSTTILEAYNIAERPAEIDFLGMQIRDRHDLADGEIDQAAYADNDGEADAGETLSIWPIIRTTFGDAKNVKFRLEMGDEYEDSTLVDFITPTADFGMNLTAYGKGVSVNPLKLKISDKCADARHIKLKVVATADGTPQEYSRSFTITVNNIHKIGGIIDRDTTLTADKTWYVNSSLAVPQGVKLTIEPGARLEFGGGVGISSLGHIIARGTPEKPIVFAPHIDGDNWDGIKDNMVDTLSFCKFSNIYDVGYDDSPYLRDCEFSNGRYSGLFGERNNVVNSSVSISDYESNFIKSNWINNIIGGAVPSYRRIVGSNYFNNDHNEYWFGVRSDVPVIVRAENPSYFGTAREDLIRPHIWEIGNITGTYGKIDLSNMLKEPVHEAHGIVWKVVVDGKDAQDEYEQLPPLGVGRHEFCVWFNRPMNVAKAPQISFGVRSPYSQIAVAEDGSWSADSTKYTAYVTITGKTSSDGINQIYVRGAEDNEYFECPYENTRFRVQVQAAGSLATGFEAEPGLGKVSLKWNNENNDFSDAMGFNVYRYEMVNDSVSGDTLRLNREIIDADSVSYTDYSVTAGKTYYYYYKVLSTDLKEYDVSNIVAAKVLTGERGDANGSGNVDVADVITTVNYSIGDRPKPFLFEAADMNADNTIDVLDVVGIIEKILGKDGGSNASAQATATYSVEGGKVWVNSPVALAGVQVMVKPQGDNRPTAAADLDGFEQAGAWIHGDDYVFLGYNVNGKTIPSGKHAILDIGDEAEVKGIVLSDPRGKNVNVEGEITSVNQLKTTTLGRRGIYTTDGVKVEVDEDKIGSLPHGVYIINGNKVLR